MIRIKIESPINCLKYNGEVEVKNQIYYYIIIEDNKGDHEVHWLGIAPQSKRDIEFKLIQQLLKQITIKDVKRNTNTESKTSLY